MIHVNENIKIHDCTLREGSQAPGISFSLQDKLQITELLDDLGIYSMEGGWPGLNEKDTAYFKEISKRKFKNIKIIGFGRTKNHNNTADNDSILNYLIKSGTPFGHLCDKGWDKHIHEILDISLEHNLDIIYESITYLKKHLDEVSFGFEHFFDAYRHNREYCLKVVETAISAGVDWIDMADTNGGSFPHQIGTIAAEVTEKFPVPFAIHCHNDTGCAVANTIAGIMNGISIAQGTVNGYAERCGMTDLCTLIPNLQIKLGYNCIPQENMKNLSSISRETAEMAQADIDRRSPYTGAFAFSHKGGIHANSVIKSDCTYQHIDPSLVGNSSKVIISELSGRSNIKHYLAKAGLLDLCTDADIKKLLQTVKHMEYSGYDFDLAEGSLFLQSLKQLKEFNPHIVLQKYSAQFTGNELKPESLSFKGIFHFFNEINILNDIEIYFEIPGSKAFFHAAKRLLGEVSPYIPEAGDIVFLDYQIRVLEHNDTQPVTNENAHIRVILKCRNDLKTWTVCGLGGNVISALCNAFLEALEFRLHFEKIKYNSDKGDYND